MPDPIWYHLRFSRSQPPGLAATDEARRRIYVAALAQFDELMEASLRVSAASRPLPMFYALAQAGRAIVAAHSPNPPPKLHGLTLNDPDPNPMATTVLALKDGWYQAVSDTTASPLIKSAALGQIWSALPDLADSPLPTGDWPKALQVVPTPTKFPWIDVKTASVAVLFDPWPTDPNDAAVRLRRYPTVRPASIATPPGSPGDLITDYTDAGRGVRVYLTLHDEDPPTPSFTLIEQRAPEYRFPEYRWLVPAIEEGVVVTPLMLWWILLFSLSMLTRYHPDEWVAALDLNQSRLAVPIQDALEIAQGAIPHLVLEALLREPVRVRRP